MATVLVTGANGGIGSATVAELTRGGHTVIPITRSDADLSLMREVNHLAAEIAGKYQALDSLVLNAGLATSGLEMTAEGYETTFAVNHLGAFLLAHRLLPLLRASGSGRIVLTGSSDHMAVKSADGRKLTNGDNPGYTRTYAHSKAVAMAAMLEMAQRLKPDGFDEAEEPEEQPTFVRVNVADPGWTRTGLTRNAPYGIRLLVRAGRPLQNRPKHSAKVLADLATATPETAAYIGIKGALSTSPLIQEKEFRKRIYDDTVGLLVEGGFALESDFLTSR